MTETEARAWLAAIAESVNDAIIGKDLDGIVNSWNQAAEAMFGYAASEIIGQPITRIIPEERIGEEALILGRVGRGERLAHFATERRRKDGAIIPVSLTISPIRDRQGRIVGVSKIARDLSETQKVHGELRRREALLRSVLETVPDAMIIIDEHGVIQSFSAMAERLFGFSAGEALGQNVSILMPAPYRGEHDGYVARYIETRERRVIGHRRVVLGQRKDGGTFPMELSVGEVALPGARLFTGFVHDLTERQEQQRRLEEMQAELIHVSRMNELGQMVSVLAHEVNQPLAAIGNYLGGIRRLLAAGRAEGVERAVGQMAEQAERARQIIQRLRDLVKKGGTERRPEDLRKTIEEASALALLGAGQRLKLEMALADDAAEAVMDKIQIQQVLINLIRNAVEAMAGQPSGRLSISAKRAGGMIEIGIADTGPGLPETVRARLFQPFVTTKPAGLGVGLSVCRTIIEAHGGEIRAGEAEGGGAVFSFTIPRAGA